MAVRTQLEREYELDESPRGSRRDTGLRLIPSPKPLTPEGAGILAAIVLFGFAAWAYGHIRALEEEIQDRADAEDARAALAEAERVGTIPWEEIKREHGL